VRAADMTDPISVKGIASQAVLIRGLLLTLSCLSPVFSIYGVGADVCNMPGRVLPCCF